MIFKNNKFSAALQQMGIPNLRSWQEAPLTTILEGRDVFVAAPTGGGKSMLYQMPAVMDEGNTLTVVISPLRALQVDQVAQLQQRGFRAELLNSDLSKTERQTILDGLPKTSLLYTTPEQLYRQDLLSALERCCVARVAIDEAHVLPQAMLSFRKAYGEIDKFLVRLPQRPQVIACTATATTKTRKRILRALGITDAEIFALPVRRENLRIQIKKIEGSKQHSARWLMLRMIEAELREWKEKKKGKRGAVIIYAPTVKEVKRIHKWLRAQGWKVKKYTGKMNQEKRRDAQQAFLSGNTPIIVATNAFGLGINKPDVRLVIHAGLPLGMGGYVQEIGRAGRDGKESKCLLLYSPGDFGRNQNILNQKANRKAAYLALRDLDALKELIKSKKCLWRQIEKYFGEKPGKGCKKCCHCQHAK